MKNKLTLVLFICIIFSGKAQVVFEPIHSPVYSFLERLTIKGIVDENLSLLPKSRADILENLLQAKSNNDKLTSLEKEELKFYLKDFYIENNREKQEKFSSLFTNNDSISFSLYTIKDKYFSFRFNAVIGIKYGINYDKGYYHRRGGLSGFGYLGESFGFSFSFSDNLESGGGIDRAKYLTKEPGVMILSGLDKEMIYDETHGSITYSWNWGNLSLAKENMTWGAGNSGKLILSDKAPSFPMIKLEIEPFEWAKLIYFHGWLKSEVIDSNTIRKNAVNRLDSYENVPKYMASHILMISPFRNLDIFLGESIVYSGRIEPIYFIPVLFFRMADHYIMGESNSGGNAQMFASLDYKIPQLRSKIYSTLFIDELSTEQIFKGNNYSATGVAIGMEIIDPVIKNSVLYFEYTRIKPFVYMNGNDANHYKNSVYQLGHWIGSNGDIISLGYNQRFFRGFQAELSAEYIRKGSIENPDEQYQFILDKINLPEFLYGKQYRQKRFSLLLNYEIMNQVRVTGYFSVSDITDEDTERTAELLKGRKTTMGLSFQYGI